MDLSKNLSSGFTIIHKNDSDYLSKPICCGWQFMMRIEDSQVVAPQIVNIETGEVDNEMVDELLDRIVALRQKINSTHAKVSLFYNIATLVVETKTHKWSA